VNQLKLSELLWTRNNIYVHTNYDSTQDKNKEHIDNPGNCSVRVLRQQLIFKGRQNAGHKYRTESIIPELAVLRPAFCKPVFFAERRTQNSQKAA
jgi:hypothetical protein